MNNVCEQIQGMIIPYINKTLNRSEIQEVVSHLASCHTCRKEAALLIKLSKELNKDIKEVPEELKTLAYNKVNQLIEQESIDEVLSKDTISETLIETLKKKKVPTPSIALELLNALLSPVQNTIKLSLKNN